MGDTDYRRDFLLRFLSMFDGPKHEVTAEDPHMIRERLWWPDCPDEEEQVRWLVSASGVPGRLCYELVSFIASHELLDIDRIQVPRRQLFESFSRARGGEISYADFVCALDELLSVSVARFQGGEEVDAFYVHE